MLHVSPQTATFFLSNRTYLLASLHSTSGGSCWGSPARAKCFRAQLCGAGRNTHVTVLAFPEVFLNLLNSVADEPSWRGIPCFMAAQ